MTLVKNWKFPICLFLGNMGIEITFDDQLDKEQAHLDKKILILHCCHTEIFLKEFSHDVGEKLEVSSLFFFFFFLTK